MEFTFEKLDKCHKKELADILNFYIENSTAAYREKTVDSDFSIRFLEGEDIYCSFVMKTDEGKIIGFCTLEPYMPIPTFSEIAEIMYFIHPEYTGKGLGSIALKKLESEARKRGIKKILADISTDNLESINFHLKNSFVEYGRLQNAGKKIGRYFGIVYLSKEL